MKLFIILSIIAIAASLLVYGDNKDNKKKRSNPSDTDKDREYNKTSSLKVYDELYDGGPKIYKSGNVSEEDMSAAVKNAKTAYAENLRDANRSSLEGKIDDIYIFAEGDAAYFYRNINGRLAYGRRFDGNVQAWANVMSIIADGDMIPKGM